MGLARSGDLLIPTARRKNPQVERTTFQALEARVARLEAALARLELADTPAPEPEEGGEGWTVKKLRARLGELHIEVPRGLTKEDLLALLPEDER